MAIAYEPRRFKTTADYYVRGRLTYPDELVVRVVALTGLTLEDRVLDLGCGPGFLAAPFAPYSREVVGMDPEPNMLAAARDYAARLGQKVTLVAGSSYDLAPAFGSFRLVTMGRSFHWMDREATLEKLAALTPERSAMALFHDSHCALPENAWRSATRQCSPRTAQRTKASASGNRPTGYRTRLTCSPLILTTWSAFRLT